MVCLPCFVVPVALLFWRFLLWPLIRPLYLRWYNNPDEKQTVNGTLEKLDKLGEDGCPFGCPIKPKDSAPPRKVIADADEKKLI